MTKDHRLIDFERPDLPTIPIMNLQSPQTLAYQLLTSIGYLGTHIATANPSELHSDQNIVRVLQCRNRAIFELELLNALQNEG
jgi:hypothetical protein